ncbi:DedA family protein [Nitratifractor salsuginis]|uniref:SNARE associated Golgi protein-like protein n=1 Tax=Nitratifractor salsuginis (strain DSM 16511 / JCM 12458 / E9I37-1) TaxID=749222 RepID=E6X0S6_NITSE|nr:DedA family protein [Nitratifractor salsuginis]ADV45796.1 SNARE associated Golgi protein-like protein [Nitratifractor salsuginis DSM 16511]
MECNIQLHSIVDWIVQTVNAWGYFGIFAAMFLESSFFPFPSEVIMIPAGYLAFKGEMSLLLAIGVGIAGSLAGALFNYWLAMHFGRPFLLRYGRYLFLKPETLDHLERFFARHGEISTFNGRLIPGIRQYISLPAGLARMPVGRFALYTALGAGIWVTVLGLLGYFLGAHEDRVAHYLHNATLLALVGVAGLSLFYWLRHRAKEEL